MQAAPPAAPSLGLQFPAGADGSRSSTRAGTAILATALQPLSAAAAQAARDERHWRRNYPAHFRALVRGGLAQAELAFQSAADGLAETRRQLVFETQAGALPLAEAMALESPAPLGRQTLRGHGNPHPAAWGLPLGGRVLQGEAVVEQVQRWAEAGVIEPSAADALARCARHPEWFDLSDRHLALLGAGSEAGPLRWLLHWRANLHAIDIDRPAVWQRLAGWVAEGNATLHHPMKDGQAGADLLLDTPRIAAWLRGQGVALDLASLAYLDGEKHLRVSLAMDLIAESLQQHGALASLAYLATPTDVFAVPGDVVAAAQRAYAERPLLSRGLQQPLRLLHLGRGERLFQPQYDDGLVAGWGLSDALVIEQGPNYALAKRLQQWRASCALRDGLPVSLNVAPSTTTASVVKNPALAAGFAGASAFGIEVFEPATTNAMMAALWVHDLRQPAPRFAHPAALPAHQACHGGLWRSPYLPRSALPFAAALGWVRQRLA